LRINLLLKVDRALCQDDFTSRADMSLEQMAAVCSPILHPDYGMSMHNRFSVLQGNIANERQKFYLFVERN
jgi:hypothetical protein